MLLKCSWLKCSLHQIWNYCDFEMKTSMDSHFENITDILVGWWSFTYHSARLSAISERIVGWRWYADDNQIEPQRRTFSMLAPPSRVFTVQSSTDSMIIPPFVIAADRVTALNSIKFILSRSPIQVLTWVDMSGMCVCMRVRAFLWIYFMQRHKFDVPKRS